MQALSPIFLLALKLVAFVFVILMSLFLLVSFAILTFLVAPLEKVSCRFRTRSLVRH